jgi:hypothetical protein
MIPSGQTKTSTARDLKSWLENLAAIWLANIDALLEFHRRNGHFKVPIQTGGDNSLRSWVNRQSSLQRLGKLKAERRQRLLDAGFVFESIVRRERLRTWEENFARLQEFHQAHGHFNIPPGQKGIKGSHSLFRWVQKQRVLKRIGRLSLEHQQRLEAVGLPWRQRGGLAAAGWQRYFAQLAAYHQRFGHCLVPQDWPENQRLARWVGFQRQRHESGALSPEEIAQLESLGFAWKIKTYSDGIWDRQFARLVDYQQRFGHCRVPQHCPGHMGLDRWLQIQRLLLKFGKLKPERVVRLKSVDFPGDLPVP